MGTYANTLGGDQGVAEKCSKVYAAKPDTQYIPDRHRDQVVTLAQHRQQALWQAFRLSVEIDLIERTPESKLLRTIAHREWGNAFLGRRVA